MLVHIEWSKLSLFCRFGLKSWNKLEFISFKQLLYLFIYYYCSQEVAQSIETLPNEVQVTNLNLHPPLVRTCQKKKIIILMYKSWTHGYIFLLYLLLMNSWCIGLYEATKSVD